MKAEKSCGEPNLYSKPSFFMLAIVSGDCNAALIAVLSFSTMSGGVPAGAHIPAQNSRESSSNPSSFRVGTFTIAFRTRCGERLDPALANERQHRRRRRPVDVNAAAEH